jgi:hypothetical protein
VRAISHRSMGDDDPPVLGDEEQRFRDLDERFDRQMPRDRSPEPLAPRSAAGK